VFRRLLETVVRPLLFVAALVREAAVTVIVYWVTRRPRPNDDPPAPPRAP
jgi:hypothetical protein